MQRHNRKSEDQLAWSEASNRVRLEGRLILARVLDSVLSDLNEQMLDALTAGRIVDIEIGRDEIKRRLLATAKRELGSGR